MTDPSPELLVVVLRYLIMGVLGLYQCWSTSPGVKGQAKSRGEVRVTHSPEAVEGLMRAHSARGRAGRRGPGALCRLVCSLNLFV